MIVTMFRSKLDVDFPYWQLSEQKVAEQESYTVKL
jgi:LemA protein